MDFNIYYDIKNNGKNEYIRTNYNLVQNYIEEAQKYYNLKYNTKTKATSIIYPFRIGEFVLYLLSNNPSFDSKTNIQIDFIKQYLEECTINNKYFTINIFLSFIRDVLQIPELVYSIQYYSSNYYSDIDISSGLNKKNIKTRLFAFEKNVNKISIDKTYICNSIIMFILVSLFEILNNGYKINKCINCGNLFINNGIDTNTQYCNYISPQNKNKSCFKYRKTASFQEIRKNNEIYNIHNSIYNLLNKRRKRAEEKSNEDLSYMNDKLVKECQEALDNFRDWYFEKTKEYKNRNLTKEQFINLLEEQYIKYREKKNNGSTRNNKE